MRIFRHSLTQTLLLSILCASFFLVSQYVSAMGMDADMMCTCQMDPKLPRYCPTVFCKDTTSGFTTAGMCVTPFKCLAKSTGGGGLTDISSLLSSISQLISALKPPPGGGGGSPPPDGGGGGGSGCPQYYQVSTPSSDPCATYVPSTSSNVNGNSNDLSGLSSSLISDSLVTPPASVSSSIPAAPAATAARPATASTSPAVVPIKFVPNSQLNGDIRISQNGATLVVTNQVGQSNVVTATMYGSGASSVAQSQSIAAGWCQMRPWTTGFLAGIAPAAFFDNLCILRGYRVGAPAVIVPAAPTVSLTQAKTTAPKPATTTAKVASTTPSLPMQADIWAVPASVPLGSRTTIFWNSKNASTCTETSPDGSFSNNTLSGGGATVPLAGPTTFTISCVAPDGTHITNFVTVTISL